MTTTMTIRQAAAQVPTWDHIYAIAHGYGWEEFAMQIDPNDPDQSGRFIAERDMMPDCEHPDAGYDYIDDVMRCMECDEPL